MIKRMIAFGLSFVLMLGILSGGDGTYGLALESNQTVSGAGVSVGDTNKDKKPLSNKPGKVKGLKVKKSHGKFIVTWKKVPGASGYQVYTKVYVKGIRTKYSKAKTLKSRKFKRGILVRHMKYGFKVRAYKKIKGKKVYGAFATKTKRY